MRVEVAEAVRGSAPFVNEVQRITIAPNGTSLPVGTFCLVVGRDRTVPLTSDVSAPDLVAALEQLPSIRSVINVDSGTEDSLTWTVTFLSPGPQTLLTSPCEKLADGTSPPECLLEDATVDIRRVVPGSSPASGSFRLRLVPSNGESGSTSMVHASTTAPLPFDATADEVQTALVSSMGGQKATVTVAHNARTEYGFEWAVTLHDSGASYIELADVLLDGPGPWCTDGITGPETAGTPCEFPFTMDEDGRDTHFNCAGAVGSNPGWCSTSPTFNESQGWGGCMRCAEGALASPTIHVASLRRSFRFSGLSWQVSLALSEAVYHPRALWNAWLGGLDEVSARWYDESISDSSDMFSGAKARSVSQVFVLPVNDPPTVTIGQKSRVAYEGEEILLEDIDIWDPDLAERPEVSIRVQIEAKLGTLALGNPSGLTFVSGSPEPHSSGGLVITGPLATVRKSIQQLYYRPLKGLTAGATAVRATREVQRLELTAPLVPMVQSITTSAVKGYIEGNFTLLLNCSVFLEAVDELFVDADNVSYSELDSYASVVQSQMFAADAPATGNNSMEVGIRALLMDCVALAWERANVLTNLSNATSLGNSSSVGNFTEDMLPNRAATAVVSKGEPDPHGSLRWVVTLIGVPPSFPAFQLGSNNLTGAGGDAQESQHTYYDSSRLSEVPSISIDIVQAASSLYGPQGSFTLTTVPGGVATEPISTLASGEDVEAALTALADVAAVQVSTGPLQTSSPAVPSMGKYWEITFLESGSPMHIGDLPPLQVNGDNLEGEGVTMRVSEAAKGSTPNDSVAIVVDDLGNVGTGEALQAAAAWSIAIVPQNVAPVVNVDRTASPKGFSRVFEGTVVQLGTVQISHTVAWETMMDDASQQLRYLARLTCSRGSVMPASSAVGHDLIVTLPSATATVLSGTLTDINRALSSLNYYAPRRYRGADNVDVTVRVAGLGVEGSWGAATLYVFVDGGNNAPELSAPRSLRTNGALPVIVAGISVADDDPVGIMTVTVEAARGLVSFPVSHRLQQLDGSEVRYITIHTILSKQQV